MRMRSLLLSIFLLSFFWSYAQPGKSSDELELTNGLSFPLGEYVKKDITNSSSGFAKTGAFLKINYTHFVNKSYGFTAAIHGQRNPLHTEALETSLSQVNFYESVFVGSTPNQNPTQYSYSTCGNWKFEKKSWMFGSLLFGGYGQVSPNQSRNLLLIAKAMLGPVYAHAPEINGKSISDTAVVQINQSSVSAFGMAYSITGGLKLKLTCKFYLLTQVEYLGTNKILFKDIKVTFTSANYSNGSPTSASMQGSTVNGKQQISSININMGIGISL